MVKLSSLRRDPALERSGVWVSYPFGGRFKVGRSNAPEFEAACRKLLEPHVARVRTGAMSHSERAQVLLPALVRFCILDWDIEGEDGKSMPFSIEEAQKQLGQPELSDLLEWLYAQADNAALFRAQAQNEALGN